MGRSILCHRQDEHLVLLHPKISKLSEHCYSYWPFKLYKGPKPVASRVEPETQDDPHEAKQRVIGSNDDHDDNVDEAVNDPDLLQPQHYL